MFIKYYIIYYISQQSVEKNVATWDLLHCTANRASSQFTPFQKSHIKSEIKIRSSDTALVCLTLMQIKYPR